MYIVTKKLCKDWEAGKIFTLMVFIDYFRLGQRFSEKVLEAFVKAGYIKPYKPKK